ncbi:uncharacterized protein [Pyrus communis]|uniref:uncharacterized protein n=1 Tax=Pyrus communis TaxID=23211 RepID=UPI0035C0641C
MAGVMACQETKEQPQWDGSVAGRSYKPRNREMAHETLMNNYFNSNSVYIEEDFRCRFRMRRHVFEPDAMDDTYGMFESTCLDNLAEFCHTVVQIYKEEYLREPNQVDLERLIRKAEDCGFPSMIRVLGSQIDVTILGCSPFFNNPTDSKSPQLDYYINGCQYIMRYYLVDNIYPKWVTLVQAIANLVDDAQRWFILHQKAYRKDVERAFGILQAQWKIIKEPARGWSRDKLNSIMVSCIILHNIIMEHERDGYIDGESDDNQDDLNRSRRAKIYDVLNLPLDPRTGNISLNEYMRCHMMIRSHATNKYLQ